MDRFKEFTGEKSPQQLTEQDIWQFLSHLVVEKPLAASTQNQALNALIFFFRHGLNKERTEGIAAVRSYRKPRLPVMLSREEIQAIFNRLSGNLFADGSTDIRLWIAAPGMLAPAGKRY